ncbi:uncharacterized protein LOC108098280 isoform X2 [Drosophila ficusphila]|uniref:uncharacterized protein LOC108098280 isoform X2 n=1 Tax=Drosophila ficusphila TaxID=30025 RepID=UPI0007E786C7|nr:uncharacterized protein LOC108098280 isoform X2 [Drosophila ficusphila]
MDLDLNGNNVLDSCWKVGRFKNRSSAFAQFDRNELKAVNISSCWYETYICVLHIRVTHKIFVKFISKQITDLIEVNAERLRVSIPFATRSKQNVSFKEISCLVYGATEIYRFQVDILLGDTKYLLDQMKHTNFDFVLSTSNSVKVEEVEVKFNRKRKRVITKKSKVTLAKLPRLQEPELLNESVQVYYKNMLSECQMWESECTQQVIDEFHEYIEIPRNCTQASSYHDITLTEEIEIIEDRSIIMPSEGFGESDELDLTIFEELYPKGEQRKSFKRSLTAQDPSDILPEKMPRLDESNIFQADNAIMAQIFPNNIDSVCDPALPSISPTSVKNSFSQPKNLRKKKLIIDKHIKYTRKQLMKHRCKYLKEYMDRVVVPQKPSFGKTPNELLCKLNKINIFPDITQHSVLDLNAEELECESEITLRAIFGSEFTENLAKEIFFLEKVLRKSKNQNVYNNQAGPLELEDILPVPVPNVSLETKSNNNNLYNKSVDCENKHFDTHSVMMDLLNIWRSYPEIKGIDGNDFIKSYADRIKASLAFVNLLYLVRDNFIEISKRTNSIEMHQITLGKESAKLIENVMQEELS